MTLAIVITPRLLPYNILLRVAFQQANEKISLNYAFEKSMWAIHNHSRALWGLCPAEIMLPADSLKKMVVLCTSSQFTGDTVFFLPLQCPVALDLYSFCCGCHN